MHILVAFDGSTESENALARALEITDVTDAEVTVVHAVHEADSGGTEDPQAVLDAASERAKDQNISIETELLVGDPIERLTEYAESTDIDVIYIGHGGLAQKGDSAPESAEESMGSVAKGLLENTSVPVTVFDKDI